MLGPFAQALYLILTRVELMNKKRKDKLKWGYVNPCSCDDPNLYGFYQESFFLFRGVTWTQYKLREFAINDDK